MSSRRVYITLNDKKEKDKVIIDYLSQSYSESDAIKDILYKVATNNPQSVQIIPNSNKKLQSDDKSNDKVQTGNKNKRGNKVQKGANITVKVQKDIKAKSNKEVLKGADNFRKVQSDTKSIIKERNDTLRANELEQLKKFM